VCGAYEGSALVANGWAQGQGVARQVRALQAATADGVSLYVRPEPGNAAEVSLVAQSLERLRELSGPGGLLILDSACGQPKTLCEIARAELQFIVPLRAQTGFRERFLTDVGDDGLRALRYLSQREQGIPPELRTKYRGALRDWHVEDPETGEPRHFRVAYVHSSEEQREVAAARERALVKAEAALERVRNGLGGRYYKTRKQVDARVARILTGQVQQLITVTTATRNRRPTITWARDQNAIQQAASTDGIYALATNLPGKRLTAGQVLRSYKGQQIVERRHRDYKQTLKVRPIFLHNDDRIYALTSIIGIALLIFGLIETELRKALDQHDAEQILGLLPEGRAAKPTGRNVLGVFQGLGLTYTHAGIQLDRLTHTQRRVLDLLQITPPWREQTTEDLALSNCGKRG
jgi:transposase